MSETPLPHIPSDLAGWAWERSPAGTVRLALAADGLATRYYPPTLDPATGAANALDEARALIAREAALVAQEAGVVEVVEAFRYDALSAEARVVVQQATKEIRDELDLMRQSAIKIGRRLIDVRERLPHGTWGPWLQSEFGWSQQTATNYMRQAQLAGQNPKFLEFEDRIDPSARILLAAPSTPEPAREEALARAEAGERVRHQDAKEIVQAAKGGQAAHARPAGAPGEAEYEAAVAAFAARGYELTCATRPGLPRGCPPYWVRGPQGRTRGAGTWAEVEALLAELGPNRPEPVAPPSAPAPEETADPLSPFDRHALTKLGYLITERTRLREDDVWEYELRPPATAYGRAPAFWATLRRIGAIVTGKEGPDLPPPPPAAPATAPALASELLDGNGRQPYGAKGADRWLPIVPHVLIIGERTHRYAPAPLIRAATIYDTPTTVRVKRPDGKEETQAQHKVWAVPDDTAWAEIEAANAAFGAALSAFADVLRELGRYDKRLAENGGIKQVPSGPLCPSVARADDPDANNQSSWWLTPWHVPHLERRAIERHTAKMLATGDIGSYVFTQSDSWLLADDAAWERVSAAQQACKDAAAAAVALLERLGTYEDARDGRHQRRRVEPPLDVAGAFVDIRAAVAAQEQTTLASGAEDDDADLDGQMVAAVGAILGGLPEPAVRILAAALCFDDASEAAFTAPIDDIYAGFAEVARQQAYGVLPERYRAGARAALAELGLAGTPQKAAAD